jgi:DNA-binding transcriptional MerR regulator
MAGMDASSKLIPIGRFARLSGLSVGALRHYDELDLLRPADVDRFTGYRRYRTEQLEIARAIGLLRASGCPCGPLSEALARNTAILRVVASFIGYPNRKVLAVFDDQAALDRAVEAVRSGGIEPRDVETFAGAADAERFDATGARHGILARLRRVMQFSLMDQLPAIAWYEAALREGKSVVAVRTGGRVTTLQAVQALRGAGGHFINRFGRFDTEEFARWRGPEPRVPSLMKH